jgi:hypothetical protein
MSTHRDPGLDRPTAENLLGGTAGGPDRLSKVLAAAAAPAAPRELTGEGLALAEYRAASLDPIGPPRRTSMLKTTVSKVLAAKLLAASAVAVLATGGVAVAAATNTLPEPAQRAAHNAFNAPAPHHGKPKHNHGQDKQKAPKSSDANKGSPAPSPSLDGLCHAYQAGVANHHPKKLTNPAFHALVVAAGGADKLGAYCTKLIGAPGTHPSDEPDDPEDTSSAHPTGKPSAHPTGKPSTHPTSKSSEHPSSGHPTSAPVSPSSTHTS